MTQTWHNLLFAHWPVPPEALHDKIPSGLELDLCNGTAWLGVVVFRLSGIRLRGTPEVPLVSSFPEVNLRTYVKSAGKPGVYFLSLDADNPLAIAMARPWFRLNYHLAKIHLVEHGDQVAFHSKRVEWDTQRAEFAVSYRPCPHPIEHEESSLERWLTERYCYYSGGRGRLYRCEIHHPPWQLFGAEAVIKKNTLAQAQGIDIPECKPLLHYAHKMKAVIWRLARA